MSAIPHQFHNVVAAFRKGIVIFMLVGQLAMPPAALAQAPQGDPQGDLQGGPDGGQQGGPEGDRQGALDAAFARLAEPQGEGWRIAEADILRAWSLSGSAAMDLLMRRGEQALDRGDVDEAIGHLTALTDHAPDFAGGYQLRAAAYAMIGLFGPAFEDLAHTLALEPRHFLALTQLGAMLEETGEPERALAAYRASLAIHPHQQEAIDAAARLERQLRGTDI